jgi:pantoate--beta-alanine ligase
MKKAIDSMKTARTTEEVRRNVAAWKQEGLGVGLVPTMGFLHEGHASLIRRAVAENDRVVVSIFVNPTQFGPSEDLDRYPRDLEHDLQICRSEGAELVFCPEVETMYPPGFHTAITVHSLTEGLCGRSRPTHFAGVCTVVCKLFNIVGPDNAYFGQKDAQQLAVIRRMVLDLNIPLEIVACPTVREADGLAKSSRNRFLSPEERKAALALNRSLQLAEAAVRAGERDCAILIKRMRDCLEAESLVTVDYIEIVDAGSLRPLEKVEDAALAAVAAFLGKTRLIDNRLIALS